MMRSRAALAAVAVALLASGGTLLASPDSTALGRLRADAKALRPLVRSSSARAFLAATGSLPHVAPRVVWRDSARTRAWTDTEARALADTTRARLVSREYDESFYWNTRYGSPLAYVRAIEILAGNGFGSIAKKRIADFGCGTIGHLRLLAMLGAEARGIDVDPMLRVLYAEAGDQGAVRGPLGTRGSVTLSIGRWPAETEIQTQVGDGYDLFLSKNTLKNGYIHPAQAVDPRMTVQLGVADSVFLAEVHRVLRPGGRVLIYNLCPAPAAPGKPYIPWADGRCPFPESQWRAAGFRVVAFDRDDSPAARAMGHALGWDRGESPMDLEHDLFATWSLFEKPIR